MLKYFRGQARDKLWLMMGSVPLIGANQTVFISPELALHRFDYDQ